MRKVLRFYLLWPRLEIIFVSLLPLGLIVESSIANSAAYGFSGFGSLSAAMLSLIALFRGFFFEVLTYASVRTAAILAHKGKREHWFGMTVMGLLGLFAVLVSSVNNLGWVLGGHDLLGIFALLGIILPGVFYHVYEVGLAILLPLAVGGIALVNLDHFVHDLLQKDHMDNAAVVVEEREMHRTQFLKAQRAQKSIIREAYDEIAEERAQNFIEQIRQGDMNFGSSSLPALPAGPSASAAAASMAALPTGPTVTGTVWPVNP